MRARTLRIVANTETSRGETDVDIPSDTRALMGHILARFHAVHRRELPELGALARRVESTHAGHAQCPNGLANLHGLMMSELEHHMAREEQVLFPTLLAGEVGARPLRCARCG